MAEPTTTPDDTLSLLEQVRALRDEALALEQQSARQLEHISASFQASARNLLHYLAVRRHDIRPLQQALFRMGLSSFGVMEAHVLAALNAVIARLEEHLGLPASDAPPPPASFVDGPRLLHRHADELLGEVRDTRDVRIMVTLPSEAATDPALIPALIAAGMGIARINCAHDGPDAWLSMVRRVRDAALAQGRPCHIQIDLAGPKSRTGSISSLGRVLKIHPQRDFRGHVTREALLWLTPLDAPHPAPVPDAQSMMIHATCEEPLKPGTRLELTDARGRHRVGQLVRHSPEGCLFSFDQTAYIEDGTIINLRHGSKQLVRAALSGAPDVPEEIRLRPGDTLILTRADLPGHAARHDKHGQLIEPARLHCTLEAAFDEARPEQRVWLDDGRIGAVITDNNGQQLTLTITHAAPEGSRIKEGKGINFPDTDFHVPALTAKDLADLEVMAAHVDMVALSFLRSPADVEQLQGKLAELGREDMGIVLKIENRQAFHNLPGILLAGMVSPRLGIMIARGDLAVEMGFERLSEVQEEMLWLCEAAHVPVIWATQILENLAKSGAPSRPEVTDAAMSIRAECAMLNKGGPHIIEAVRFLDAVLARMEGHFTKRMAMRRRLSIADYR